jgi:hypothetical protein
MQPKDSAKGSGSYWPYSRPLLLVLATVRLLARLAVATRADLNTPQAGEQRAFTEFQKRTSDWDFMPYMNIGGIGMSFIVQKQQTICERHTGRTVNSDKDAAPG